MADQTITVGVLALQGAFVEHITLLQRAATTSPTLSARSFDFVQVRSANELGCCDALIIPGGESTTLALVARRSGLLEPLRRFVRIEKKPTWGTCAGLILLADKVDEAKEGGQQLIGGLDVRVHRNHFGRQINSFETDVALPFLDAPFRAVFIRAPVVSEVLGPSHCREHEHDHNHNCDDKTASSAREPVRVLARVGRDGAVDGDIVAVQQENLFGTSFHPELTNDTRIHAWWLQQLLLTTVH